MGTPTFGAVGVAVCSGHPNAGPFPPRAAAMRRDEGCAAFGNVFTEVAENSAHGTVVARLPPGGGGVGGPGLQLCLEGADAAWFYLDGSSVRLNASNGRSLDREVGGPIRPPDSP